MYHDANNLSLPKDKTSEQKLFTGYYSFFFKGGYVTGHLKRIGAETVHIDCPGMGLIEMKTLEFLDSGFQKL